jgi:hypothetical protein
MALTTIAVSFHCESLSQVAKFLPINVGISFGHEVGNRKSFSNFGVYSLIKFGHGAQSQVVLYGHAKQGSPSL